jgi:putative transposase
VDYNSKKRINVRSSCRLLGYARSSYYKQLKRSQVKKSTQMEVLNHVYSIRQQMPKIGGRKLHYLLRKTLLQSGNIELGRDRLFDLLRENNLLIERRKKYAITTNSNHPFKVYRNLILKEVVNHANQSLQLKKTELVIKSQNSGSGIHGRLKIEVRTTMCLLISGHDT